jgi:hypothetical protein
LQQLKEIQFSGALILELAGPDDRTIALERAMRGRAHLLRLLTTWLKAATSSLGVIRN